MAVLVIAGSGRGVGKTAVGCALMAAMPEFSWLAVKVTSHQHDVGEDLWEELNSCSDKDTGRYLAAGARRAFLISEVKDFRIAELVSEARDRASLCGALLIESNRIAAAVVANPGECVVSIGVVAGAEAEWKPSLSECIGRLDALVLTGGLSPEGRPQEFAHMRRFRLPEGQWMTPELVDFVREQLLC